jgi:hypothetical protein
MSFKLGERVLLLNETGAGKIVEFCSDGSLRIEDEDGFILTRSVGEVCKIVSDAIRVNDVPSEKSQDIYAPRKGSVSSGNMWELDLHIEQLLESTSGMSNYDIVTHQMAVLKKFIQEARNKKIKKILIIHGVGEGKLRAEVHTYLRGLESAVFHNEHYTPKGFGATLLELFYNY